MSSNDNDVRMGRPPTGRNKSLHVKINDGQHAKLKFYAKIRGQSVSEFLADLVDTVPNLAEVLNRCENDEDFLAA